MKKALLILSISLLLFSCGYHSFDHNNGFNNNTVVNLSKNNYKFVDKVKGTATASYVFGLGGLSSSALVEEARSKMLKDAKLGGTSKALVYTTVEEHAAFYLLYSKKTVTVSGYLIQFTDNEAPATPTTEEE